MSTRWMLMLLGACLAGPVAAQNNNWIELAKVDRATWDVKFNTLTHETKDGVPVKVLTREVPLLERLLGSAALMSERMRLLGQLGILVELAGAGYLVMQAYRAARATPPGETTYGRLGPDVTEAVQAPVKALPSQVWGFVLVAVGLVMQFVAGL